MKSGDATTLASRRRVRALAPLRELERELTRVGFTVLGLGRAPGVDRRYLVGVAARYRDLVEIPLREARPEDLERITGEVQDLFA